MVGSVVGNVVGGAGWERGWELLYYSEASLELLEPLFYMEESWLGAWLEADVLQSLKSLELLYYTEESL